ncbi:MAG: hypothetical protein EAY75_05130, partial [Bacteroidetes bacterium]
MFAVRLWLICLIGFLGACAPKYSAPQAKNGLLDIRTWDFDKNTTLALDGEWEFYWQNFLKENPDLPTDTTYYIQVPSSWTRHKIKQQRLAGKG